MSHFPKSAFDRLAPAASTPAAGGEVALRDPRMEKFDKHGPLPGMIAAFETHFGQSWTDRDWRDEAVTWAAAWSRALSSQASPAPVGEVAR